MLPTVGRRQLTDARKPQPMSPCRCAHATTDACRPWLMMNVVGRRRLPDGHKQRPMSAGLG